MNELQLRLIGIVKQSKKTFTLKGAPLSYEDMFAETGILPGLAKRADQLCSLCLGYGLGIKVEDDDNGLLGVRVKFDEYTPDLSLIHI